MKLYLGTTKLMPATIGVLRNMKVERRVGNRRVVFKGLRYHCWGMHNVHVEYVDPVRSEVEPFYRVDAYINLYNLVVHGHFFRDGESRSYYCYHLLNADQTERSHMLTRIISLVRGRDLAQFKSGQLWLRQFPKSNRVVSDEIASKMYTVLTELNADLERQIAVAY